MRSPPAERAPAAAAGVFTVAPQGAQNRAGLGVSLAGAGVGAAAGAGALGSAGGARRRPAQSFLLARADVSLLDCSLPGCSNGQLSPFCAPREASVDRAAGWAERWSARCPFAKLAHAASPAAPQSPPAAPSAAAAAAPPPRPCRRRRAPCRRRPPHESSFHDESRRVPTSPRASQRVVGQPPPPAAWCRAPRSSQSCGPRLAGLAASHCRAKRAATKCTAPKRAAAATATATAAAAAPRAWSWRRGGARPEDGVALAGATGGGGRHRRLTCRRHRANLRLAPPALVVRRGTWTSPPSSEHLRRAPPMSDVAAPTTGEALRSEDAQFARMIAASSGPARPGCPHHDELQRALASCTRAQAPRERCCFNASPRLSCAVADNDGTMPIVVGALASLAAKRPRRALRAMPRPGCQLRARTRRVLPTAPAPASDPLVVMLGFAGRHARRPRKVPQSLRRQHAAPCCVRRAARGGGANVASILRAVRSESGSSILQGGLPAAGPAAACSAAAGGGRGAAAAALRHRVGRLQAR